MTTTKPAYRAFSIIERKGQDSFWLAIGAAWRHGENSDGLNVVLQALPLPGSDGQCKIVLLPPKDDDVSNEGRPRVVAGTDQNKSRSRRR